jgi:tetratricopeptide (TPR) repeat protein
MLTLQRPYPGDSFEKIVHAILTRDPLAPRRINPRVPLDLETICQKAIEKEPNRRYQTAAELAADLRNYLQHGLITARRAGPIQRTSKWVRRHPLITTVISAFVVVAVLATLVWRASMSEAAESARRAIADAQLSMNYGDYRGALSRVDEALNLDPELVEARLIRAKLLIKLWRTAEAVKEAKALLKKAPEDWRVHLILAGLAKAREVPTISAQEHIDFAESRAPETADAYYLRSLIAERPTEAIELLDRALKLNPAHIEALIERIHRYDQLKNFPEALRDCDRLIYMRPRSAEGHREKERILRRSGDLLGALAEAEEAVKLDPEDPVSYSTRATINEILGRHREAIKDITRAIELDPVNAPYHWMRATWRIVEGQFEEAIADARRALDLNPDYMTAYRPLLNAHFYLSHLDKVRVILTELAAVLEMWADPAARSGAHILIAKGSELLGEPDRALDEATHALELDPGNLNALLFRARMRHTMQDEPGAKVDCDAAARIILNESQEPSIRLRSIELGGTCDQYMEPAMKGLDQLIEDYPNWWAPYSRRATANLHIGHLEAALADCNKVIELAPRYAVGYHQRQVLRFKMRLPGTEDDFKMAIELNPYNVNLRRNWAMSMFQGGRFEEALAEVDRILKLDPIFTGAYTERGRQLAFQGRCEEAKEALNEALELALDWEKPGTRGNIAEAQVQTLFFGCPDDYDPASAVANARAPIIVEGSEDPEHWAVLGAALYHDVQYEEAREALLKAVKLAGKESPYELFMLSATDCRLGNYEQAKSHYDRAVTMMEKGSKDNPVFINYRSEAARLLGIQLQPLHKK